MPIQRRATVRNPAGQIIGEINAGCCVRQWSATGYRADGSWSQLGHFEFRAEAESAIRRWTASERRVAA